MPSDFVTDEALRQFRSLRDDQLRENQSVERKLKVIEEENRDLKLRLGVLIRTLIAREIFSAAEIATAIAVSEREANAPLSEKPVAATDGVTQPA